MASSASSQPWLRLGARCADPVCGPFSVMAQFSAPITTFTLGGLTLANATVAGLKPDGMVIAWGSNVYDQCGVPAGLAFP